MRALTSSFPPVSWRVPKMVPSSVDLPTPLGPKTAMNSPGCTSKSSLDHKGSTAAWLKETNIKLQKDGWACIFGNAQAQPSYASRDSRLDTTSSKYSKKFWLSGGVSPISII